MNYSDFIDIKENNYLKLSLFAPSNMYNLIYDFCDGYEISLDNQLMLEIFLRAFQDLEVWDYDDEMVDRIIQDKYSTNAQILAWLHAIPCPERFCGRLPLKEFDLIESAKNGIIAFIDGIYREVHTFLEKEGNIVEITYDP